MICIHNDFFALFDLFIEKTIDVSQSSLNVTQDHTIWQAEKTTERSHSMCCVYEWPYLFMHINI